WGSGRSGWALELLEVKAGRGLRPVVFGDREVVPNQAPNDVAIAVPSDHVDEDELSTRPKHRSRPRRPLSVRRHTEQHRGADNDELLPTAWAPRPLIVLPHRLSESK